MKCPNCGPLGNDFCTWEGHAAPPSYEEIEAYQKGWQDGVRAFLTLIETEDRNADVAVLANTLIMEGPQLPPLP
jgi:hypothetical protein